MDKKYTYTKFVIPLPDCDHKKDGGAFGRVVEELRNEFIEDLKKDILEYMEEADK